MKKRNPSLREETKFLIRQLKALPASIKSMSEGKRVVHMLKADREKLLLKDKAWRLVYGKLVAGLLAISYVKEEEPISKKIANDVLANVQDECPA